MENSHILAAFDKDLKQIKALIISMSELADKQISRASKALRKSDESTAQKVVEKDERMNVLENEVINEVTRTLALRQPKAGDLRAVIGVMKIASDLERIGDYTKNIARRTSDTAATSALEASTKNIKRIAKLVRKMLKDATEAYTSGDVELAMDVCKQDENVDLMYNSLLRELLTHMMEDARNITPSTHLLFIARNLERMGDHVASMAEQVIFIETGEMNYIEKQEELGEDD